MPPSLELLLIRHGQSQFNVDGTGGLDSALTLLGQEQARRLVPWLRANFQPAAFYASSMLRARQTAEILRPALGLPIQYRDDLCEADFDIGAAMPSFMHPTHAVGGDAIELDETDPRYDSFQTRVAQAFHELLMAHLVGTILIVTHGGVIATFLRTVFGAHQISVNVENTSATLLRWNNSRWYLVYSNRVEHLL